MQPSRKVSAVTSCSSLGQLRSRKTDDLQLILVAGAARPLQAADVDEVELVGEREELAEQAIADERLGGIGEQPVLALEADLGQGLRGRRLTGGGFVAPPGSRKTTSRTWLNSSS